MIFEKSTHSRLKVIVQSQKIKPGLVFTKAELEVETGIDYINQEKIFTIIWIIYAYLNNDSVHAMSYVFKTSVIIKDGNESQGDFEQILAIVVESGEIFTEKLTKFTGSEPLVGFKFQTLAIRILETLILNQ